MVHSAYSEFVFGNHCHPILDQSMEDGALRQFAAPWRSGFTSIALVQDNAAPILDQSMEDDALRQFAAPWRSGFTSIGLVQDNAAPNVFNKPPFLTASKNKNKKKNKKKNRPKGTAVIVTWMRHGIVKNSTGKEAAKIRLQQKVIKKSSNTALRKRNGKSNNSIDPNSFPESFLFLNRRANDRADRGLVKRLVESMNKLCASSTATSEEFSNSVAARMQVISKDPMAKLDAKILMRIARVRAIHDEHTPKTNTYNADAENATTATVNHIKSEKEISMPSIQEDITVVSGSMQQVQRPANNNVPPKRLSKRALFLQKNTHAKRGGAAGGIPASRLMGVQGVTARSWHIPPESFYFPAMRLEIGTEPMVALPSMFPYHVSSGFSDLGHTSSFSSSSATQASELEGFVSTM